MKKRIKPLGSGRKKHYPPLKRRCVSITDEQAKLLCAWGRGDMSAGLRWLIEAASVFVRKVPVERVEQRKPESGALG